MNEWLLGYRHPIGVTLLIGRNLAKQLLGHFQFILVSCLTPCVVLQAKVELRKLNKMSGASTLRNAVKRVTHKERAQPSDRKKFGLLEKHKDYIERARDFQNKQKYITNLRKKAAERNPDEFYHHMHNSKVINGKHVELKKNKELDQDTIDLLKSQDMGYIVYKKSVDDKKVAKLKENIHLIGDFKPKKHTLFIDEGSDLEAFDVAKHFNTRPELLERAYNRPTNELLEKVAEESPEMLNAMVVAATSNKKNKRSAELAELKQRAKRAKRLESAMAALHVQRNLTMGKGTKKKITLTKTVGKQKKEKEVTVYKWKRQRSK